MCDADGDAAVAVVAGTISFRSESCHQAADLVKAILEKEGFGAAAMAAAEAKAKALAAAAGAPASVGAVEDAIPATAATTTAVTKGGTERIIILPPKVCFNSLCVSSC